MEGSGSREEFDARAVRAELANTTSGAGVLPRLFYNHATIVDAAS